MALDPGVSAPARTRDAHPGRDDGAPAIVVTGLHVVRGGAAILRGVTFAVPRGMVYGLVGPSGSGKTTLIRAIVGRQRIAAGAINVLDLPAGSSASRRLVGYMPQAPAVYEELTARENLAFLAGVYGVPAARVSEVLTLVDLTGVAGRPVYTYSGGQRQRVALAAALIATPRLLLLDEPTVGLDPRLRRDLWAQFHAWAEAGTTVLVSTHIMDEAAHTDRLAFLSDGRVLAEDTPQNLMARTGADQLEDAVLRLMGEPAPTGPEP